MPILSSQFISTLKMLKFNSDDPIESYYVLLESFTYDQVQEVTQKNYIQGNRNTHIMDIGGMYWKSTFQSPVFIFFDEGIGGSLDLLWAALGNVNADAKFCIYPRAIGAALLQTIILESGSIKFSNNGVTTSTSFISDFDMTALPTNVFDVTMDNALNPNTGSIFGRTARNYDTTLRIGDIDAFIQGGSIDFKLDVSKNYFLGTSGFQPPFFAVNNIQISGDLKIAYNPLAHPIDTVAQTYGGLSVDGTGIHFTCQDYYMDFNNAKVVFSNLNKSINTDSLVTADIKFESFSPVIDVGGHMV